VVDQIHDRKVKEIATGIVEIIKEQDDPKRLGSGDI
jgi:hypothetical protein